MMASYNDKPLYFFLLSCLATICFVSLTHGITVDLIHPDSPQSPLYNPNETRFDRAKRAFTTSFARQSQYKSILSRDKKSMKFIASPILPSGGGYLMRVSLGSPAYDFWAIADTGSDLTWTQCQPCTNCYKQDAPLFDPRNSSSFENIPCRSQKCQTFAGGGSGCDDKGCTYFIQYGDRSSSLGSLATDAFTFQSSLGPNGIVVFTKIAFGCGFSNGGTFDEKTSGIFGLGGGPVSFINQIDKAVGGKFSYCLAPLGSNVTSQIIIGTDADVSGPDVVSTKLIRNSPDTFYFLELEGFTVGDTELRVKKSANPSQEAGGGGSGNIIIDSGTTLTFLSGDIISDFESALERAVTGGERVAGPSGFKPCYRSGGRLNVPRITVNFAGAKVEVEKESVFLEVEEGVVCSTFVGADGLGIGAIFGNLHQVNYLIGYDLTAGKLNFKKTQCGS